MARGSVDELLRELAAKEKIPVPPELTERLERLLAMLPPRGDRFGKILTYRAK